MLNCVRVILFVFAFFILGDSGCSNRMDFAERKYLFDINWKFCQGDVLTAFEVDFNDMHWKSIDLPHDWSLDRNLDHKSKNNIDPSKSCIGWYRKKFNIPSDWQNMNVSVQFEDDQLKASVYINGAYLGTNSGNSESFVFDLTPHIRYNNENIIAVQLDNSDQDGSHWSRGTGFSKHVWLLVSNPTSSRN